ncbi:hypothetical protein CEUSTIGMA_g9102.t1 [Chlamydomonas eustigma]|uniref:Helicase ATP-binding domain-containing protein n=1 Tax=Chlamydomonas eustigma TaxID=1157962 RepID=A0A250XF09_9CHLO|nr:hypothetical protein CEUSTIGMA_g9102.t1 [Chlamydomonas eustigma]|eukprot:GAX81674.1 hypothetical protein CEUSTIGMA_g9102.t1 [Chlamydomonas eustigma]
MAEGERLTLLEGLGVSYESAEQVEYGVLQKAFQEHDALRGGDDETQKPGVAEDPSAGSNADHSQELLRSLQEELDAVQSALDALNAKGDTSVKNEGGGGSSKLAAKTAKTVGKDKPSKRKSKTATSKAVQKQVTLDGITAGPASDTSQRLQVALLQSRLSSLRQKQQILLDKQKNADRTLPHPPTTMHSSQASALKLLDEDDLFCAIETSGVRGNKPGLIETERDRMIRQGLLTPFDRMEGYERTMMPSKTNVTLGGAQHDVQGDASSWLHRGGIGHLKDQVGKAGKPLEDILKDKSDKTKALVRDRPTALLVPANQLPALEPDARRLPPQFWRQSASSKKFDARPSQSLAVKRKRHTTLPRRSKGKQARKACNDKSASSSSEKDEDGNDLISVDNSSEEEQGIVQRAGDITAASTSGQRRKDAPKNVLRRSSGRDNMGKDRDESDSEYSPSQLTSGDATRQNEKREFNLKKEDNVVLGHEGASSSSSDVELIEEDLRPEVGKKKQKEEVEEEEDDDAGEYDDADSDYFEKRLARSLVTSRKSRRCLQQNVQRRNSSNRIAVANQMTAHELSPPGGSASLSSLQCDVICPDGGVVADTTREACLSNGAQAEWPTEAMKSEEHEANLSTDLIKDENYESAEDSEQDYVKFDGGFKIPTYLYSRLFPYQQTAVKWLWELRNQRTGGILGDEMGLGKTVEITAFLAGLLHSGLYRPSLIVCPATVLRQWLREVRLWAPEFRVIMFHDSARGGRGGATRLSKEDLVLKATRESPTGLLLTTYESLRAHRHLLLPVRWGIAILDEGHKIRNPDAEITLVAKQLQTVHRLIMSGSPIQNRLSELWSLFDFIFPGRLGTLPVFQAQFSIPIQVGGYTNASPLQVTTAYKCAVLLRDLIAPYLLRRRKVDVNAQLPKKTEQVLFCTLTAEQCDLYRSYLASDEVNSIIAGNMNALAGIDVLRKVCNHPDLLERATEGASQDYGNPTRSGKLTVLLRLLQHWQQGGHKALLFTQTQQMLDILEKVIRSIGYSYHRKGLT